jgi:hypothetical protein
MNFMSSSAHPFFSFPQLAPTPVQVPLARPAVARLCLLLSPASYVAVCCCLMPAAAAAAAGAR